MQKYQTNEEFIKVLKNKFPNENYDFKHTKYTGAVEKVHVICPQHGSFYKVARALEKGVKCNGCGGRGKITKEIFIERAQNQHGNKFNYSDVEFTTADVKVKITCDKGHTFMQRPADHVQGAGCKKCAVKRGVTQEVFTARIINKHGNKYNLKEVKYTDMHSKIHVICNDHGSFYPKACDFVNKNSGCPECGYIRMTTEEFIIKAKIIYGDLYDYGASKFTKADEDIYYKIQLDDGKYISCDGYSDIDGGTIYEFHGCFWHGHGCENCRGEINRINNKLYTDLHTKPLIENFKYLNKDII
jgi:hypothetical protein